MPTLLQRIVKCVIGYFAAPAIGRARFVNEIVVTALITLCLSVVFERFAMLGVLHGLIVCTRRLRSMRRWSWGLPVLLATPLAWTFFLMLSIWPKRDAAAAPSSSGAARVLAVTILFTILSIVAVIMAFVTLVRLSQFGR